MDFPALPNYNDYLAAIRKTPERAARQFWSNYLDGIRTSCLVDPQFNGQGSSVMSNVRLSESQTGDLKKLAGELKITQNTIVQGAWAIVLGKLFNSWDVAFGITVSGRSTDLDNIHLLSGMFMNVHPFRTSLDIKLTVAEWLKYIQKRQLEASEYEHLSAEQLIMYSEWPAGQALFDTLLVYENYPNLKLTNGALQASDLSSGLTSAYPLTLTVIPGIEMEFVLSVKPDILTEKQRTNLLASIIKILQLLSAKKLAHMEEIKKLKCGPEPLPVTKARNASLRGDNPPLPPRHTTDLRLLKIWESTFGKTGISIHDNYFKIGGKSLLSVRLFNLINNEFQTRLLTTTI
jgi:hypothetical protein